MNAPNADITVAVRLLFGTLATFSLDCTESQRRTLYAAAVCYRDTLDAQSKKNLKLGLGTEEITEKLAELNGEPLYPGLIRRLRGIEMDTTEDASQLTLIPADAAPVPAGAPVNTGAGDEAPDAPPASEDAMPVDPTLASALLSDEVWAALDLSPGTDLGVTWTQVQHDAAHGWLKSWNAAAATEDKSVRARLELELRAAVPEPLRAFLDDKGWL